LLFDVGGLSVPNDSDNDSFSSRALRRARIDLIFKDYEVTSAKNALGNVSSFYFLMFLATDK